VGGDRVSLYGLCDSELAWLVGNQVLFRQELRAAVGCLRFTSLVNGSLRKVREILVTYEFLSRVSGGHDDNLNLQTHFYVLNYWRAEDVSSIIRSACEAAAAPRGSVPPCPAWNSVMIRDVERSPFLFAVNFANLQPVRGFRLIRYMFPTDRSETRF